MTRGLEILQAVKKYLRIDEKVAFFIQCYFEKVLTCLSIQSLSSIHTR